MQASLKISRGGVAMNKHTATPWGIELDYRDRTKTIITSKLDDYMVASCNHAICNDPQNEANAAFICKACNSHEALVKALVEQYKLLHEIENTIVGNALNREYLASKLTKQSRAKIDAALKLAEEE